MTVIFDKDGRLKPIDIKRWKKIVAKELKDVKEEFDFKLESYNYSYQVDEYNPLHRTIIMDFWRVKE